MSEVTFQAQKMFFKKFRSGFSLILQHEIIISLTRNLLVTAQALDGLTICSCQGKGGTFFLSYLRALVGGPAGKRNKGPRAQQSGPDAQELPRPPVRRQAP